MKGRGVFGLTRKRLAGFAASGLLGILTLAPVQAERSLAGPRLIPGSQAEIQVINLLEGLPPSGFLPMRVIVKNSATVNRTWILDTKHSVPGARVTDYATTLTVPAGSERTFDLLIPLSPQVNSVSRYSSLSLAFSGPGIEDGIVTEHSSGAGRSPTVYLGMSESLVPEHWGVLRELTEKQLLASLAGSPLDPALIPSDWRGLAGFEVIVLSDTDWRGLDSGARTAISNWLVQGGHLVLCHETEAAPADLAEIAAPGVGQITLLAKEGLNDGLVELLKAAPKPTASMALQDYNWKWSPATTVGNPEPPYLAILIFVVLFALIIGPLNFLVLAPAGRRHRLFLTTPAISLAASILMGVFITIRDGIGGWGQRFDAVLVLSNERRSVLWQEQISRTGVLFSSSFPADPATVLLPIEIRSEGDFPRSRRRRSELSFFLDGTIWSGDWFRSRTTQAQVMTALASQRERLEITWENGVPVATSSFARPLRTLFYFSPDGTAIWQGRNLAPGQKTALAPANEAAFTSWRDQSLLEAGPIIRDRVSRFEGYQGGGKFFALAQGSQSLPTLRDIQWKEAGSLIFGTTAESAPPPP